MSDVEHRSVGELIWIGLRGRCPRCATGPLFNGPLKVAESCAHCGQSFVGHDIGDGPAVPATFVLGAVTVALAALLEYLLAPPLWVHALVWAPFVFGGTVWLVRLIKGVLVAMQFKYRDLDKPERPGGI